MGKWLHCSMSLKKDPWWNAKTSLMAQHDQYSWGTNLNIFVTLGMLGYAFLNCIQIK